MSRSLLDLHQAPQAVFGEWLRRCNSKGVAILVYETYRSPQRQDRLFAQGRTESGPIVTNARAGDSFHQYRCALDAVPWEFYKGRGHVIMSKLDWTPFANGRESAFRSSRDRNILDRSWKVMVEQADSLGIQWAGDWHSLIEYVHFQYTLGLTLGECQTMTKKELQIALS